MARVSHTDAVQQEPGDLLAILASGKNPDGTDFAPGDGVTLKSRRFAIATAAVTQIVAAVSSKRIVVVHARVVAGGAVGVVWQSGPEGSATDLDGEANLAANGGYIENGSVRAPVLWTKQGERLALVTDAAQPVAGRVVYYEYGGDALSDPA